MREIQKWAKNKPYLIKINAAQLVSTVQSMFEEFNTLKIRRFASKKFPLPHLPSWFALYRSHRKVTRQIEGIFSAVYGRDAVDLFSETCKEMRRKERKNEPLLLPGAQTPEIMKGSVNLLNEILAASDKDLEEEFDKAPTNPAIRRRMAKLIAKNPLELGFYLFVTVPCWILYRMHPTSLYRSARQGDFEALQKLLSLDQIMLHDPLIGKQIISYRFNHAAGKYRKLLEAALKAPKGSQSIKNILLSQVGLISTLSHFTQKPLTPQDLYELVAAYDQDSNSNLLDELPKEPAALARSLSPDRNMWRILFSSDKKI